MEQTQNTCKVAIKHNLIEQIATDKVKELIKTSGSNIVDVEIHSVTLL